MKVARIFDILQESVKIVKTVSANFLGKTDKMAEKGSWHEICSEKIGMTA